MSEFAFTEDDKTLLAGKTADQRAADQASLTKAALKRLDVLIAAEKAKKLKPGEDTELADLRALKDRVETTNRALKRKDVEQILDASGQGTVATWFGDIKKGTFLGIGLRVHKALGDRLTRAETALVNDAKVNPGKKSATDLGADLQMYVSTSDLREPAKAVGGTSLSMHTFGLAVDLNYKGNPFIGNAGAAAPDAIRRATSLVLGTATDVTTALGDAQTAYTTLKSASDALKTYFSYRDPANLPALTAQVGAHKAAAGEPADLAGWQAQIAADHEALAGKGDFKKHKPPEEGFLDLNESVVLALSGAGLTWGGTYPTDKDIMHFDLREAEGAKINTARKAHVAKPAATRAAAQTVRGRNSVRDDCGRRRIRACAPRRRCWSARVGARSSPRAEQTKVPEHPVLTLQRQVGNRAVADLLEGAGSLWDRLSTALFGDDQGPGGGSAPSKAPFQASYVGKEFEIDDPAAQVRNEDGTARRYAAGDTIPAGKKAGDPVVIPQGTKVRVSGTRGEGDANRVVDVAGWGWTKATNLRGDFHGETLSRIDATFLSNEPTHKTVGNPRATIRTKGQATRRPSRRR